MAACYAVENSLGYQCDPTTDARILRNLTLGVEFIMSHLAHFYALSALDYVQGPGNPFGSDPAVAGLPAQSGPWTPDFATSYYLDLPGGIPGLTAPTYTALTRNDQSGVWWEIIQDYTIALKLAKMAGDLMGILGGRWPMYSNLVCGGVTHPNLTGADLTAIADLAVDYLFRGSATASVATPWNGPEGPVTTPGNLGAPAQGTVLHFIQQHYIPTVQIAAAVYSNYDNSFNTGLQNGAGSWDFGLHGGLNYGQGCGNFLSWGAFHTADVGPSLDKTTHSPHILKTGVWIGGTGGGLEPGSELLSGTANPIEIAKACAREFITSSKYDDGTPSYAGGLGPDQGYTKPNKNKAGAYSWIKSPRIVSDGTYVTTPGTHVCEVGPLARMVNSGLYDCTGGTLYPFYTFCANRPILTAVRGWFAGLLAGVPLPVGQYGGISAMDRHRARAMEAEAIALAVPGLLGGLTGGPTVDPTWTIPQNGTQEGWGTNEAPRGALLHYNKHTNNRIEKYQCIVPTTWNANPRAAGNPGPIEQAIMTPGMAHSAASSPSGRGGAPQYVPVEALRVVHSFDPCIACAVHKVDGKKAKATKLNTKKEVRRR
jgi:hydrogenase large subunit